MILQALMYVCFFTGPLLIWAGVNRLRASGKQGFEAPFWGAFGITAGLALMGWAARAIYRMYIAIPGSA